MNKELRNRILKEMCETEEDRIVRELRKEPGFNESDVRRIYKKLKKTQFHGKVTK